MRAAFLLGRAMFRVPVSPSPRPASPRLPVPVSPRLPVPASPRPRVSPSLIEYPHAETLRLAQERSLHCLSRSGVGCAVA